LPSINMGNLDCVKKRIEEIIKTSPVPEDPIHSKNTLEWLLRLKPDADEALKIAALGHGIERAIRERKVRREAYKGHDDFKTAHALNSARIISEIMEKCEIEKAIIEDVFNLVSQHETGGGDRSNLLGDADAISFFDVNLPLYFTRNTREEVTRRCLWGYRRLAPDLRYLLTRFNYENKDIDALLRDVIAQEGGG